MNNCEVISCVLEVLKREELWFTQKTDPTWEEAPYYYKLDEYGDLTDKSIEKICKEVNSYIGEGAVELCDAVEVWLQDALVEYRVAYKGSLVTKFKDKPVADGIEAYESQALNESKKVEEAEDTDRLPKNVETSGDDNIKTMLSIEANMTDEDKMFYCKTSAFLMYIANAEVSIPEYYNGEEDAALEYMMELSGKDINNFNSDNSYNWGSHLYRDINIESVEGYDGKHYTAIACHIGGDVRGNYTDYALYAFDNEYDLTEALLDFPRETDDCGGNFEYKGHNFIITPQAISEYNDVYMLDKDGSAGELMELWGTSLEEIYEQLDNELGEVLDTNKKENSSKKIEDYHEGYDYYGPLTMEEFEGPAFIRYNGGPASIEVLVKARNGRFVWTNSANGISPYKFDSFQDALKIQKQVGGEILSWNRDYLGIKDTELKSENYKRRLAEENNKSANLISDMLKSSDFDSDSKAGQIVLRTSELFNALSGKGYDVQVTFDNGESTSAILLGQQGGQVLITITDTNQPLRAFTSGNFEITEDNMQIMDDIQSQISAL